MAAGQVPVPRNQVVDIADLIGKLAPTFFGSGRTNSSTTADPQAVANSNAAFQLAMGRAKSSAQADKLIQDILYRAQLAFAPVLGEEKAAGVYNSTTKLLLGQEAMSRATAAAGQAVLQHQEAMLRQAVEASNAQMAANRSSTSKTGAAINPITTLATLLGTGGIQKLFKDTKPKSPKSGAEPEELTMTQEELDAMSTTGSSEIPSGGSVVGEQATYSSGATYEGEFATVGDTGGESIAAVAGGEDAAEVGAELLSGEESVATDISPIGDIGGGAAPLATNFETPGGMSFAGYTPEINEAGISILTDGSMSTTPELLAADNSLLGALGLGGSGVGVTAGAAPGTTAAVEAAFGSGTGTAVGASAAGAEAAGAIGPLGAAGLLAIPLLLGISDLTGGKKERARRQQWLTPEEFQQEEALRTKYLQAGHSGEQVYNEESGEYERNIDQAEKQRVGKELSDLMVRNEERINERFFAIYGGE